MFEYKPVRLLVKLPAPVPSVVFELAIIGLVAVAQQIPLAVTDPPPSAEIFPPETALVGVIEVIPAVVRVGSCTEVAVNESSFP